MFYIENDQNWGYDGGIHEKKILYIMKKNS